MILAKREEAPYVGISCCAIVYIRRGRDNGLAERITVSRQEMYKGGSLIRVYSWNSVLAKVEAQ